MIPRSLAQFIYDVWDSVLEAVDSLMERLGR